MSSYQFIRVICQHNIQQEKLILTAQEDSNIYSVLYMIARLHDINLSIFITLLLIIL